jgi:2-dehydro-3-deoxyphosphogluconate aldolase/(4S)-4-hydroxy-2-oxoglutarate aldolase
VIINDAGKKLVLEKVKALGLLAVIRGPSPDMTLKMVDALVEAGVVGIEITYSTPQAAQVVRDLNEKYNDSILLGMGTLTKPGQATEAKGAGAKFIVSPHTSISLAQAMVESGLLVMMGALTPSEVVQAYELGSDIVKIFPGSLGGPKYMKSLRGPLPHIPMMPTGGVSATNVGNWFNAGAVAVGAGSALCPTNMAKEGRFEEITMIAREFRLAVEKAKKQEYIY